MITINFFLVRFLLRHINLIGHLIPNQVIENKSEKKFKGKVFGINDKLLIISCLFVLFCSFVFFIRSLFVGNHGKKTKTKKTVEQVGEGISLLEYI